jgi:hypothetical protein
MKRYRGFLAGCALFAISGAAAHADCAEDLASLTAGGISKDGSLAPLQESATPDPGAAAAEASPNPEAGESAAGAESISKDGSQSPFEGAGDAVATSAQDVEAQQRGEPTAAQQAENGSERAAAIERAQAALDAGDEAGCNAALEEARSL